ncbi:hypothetical protein FACS1894167_13170 [Synergistales bacterium]|nr:hypothetical protein FACS1894167_13170 [Synergistales bacterium]
MKVAGISDQSAGEPKKGPPGEPIVELSAENRGAATKSTAAVDTAPFDKGRLKEALKAAERLSVYSNRKLKFEYQEEADVFQVSVVAGGAEAPNGKGEEVIRKIPPDSILHMIENLRKFKPTTLDTKA